MYRLYVKFNNSKRFQPVDWKNGRPVINLIYATLFTEHEATLALMEAIRMNGDRARFELRKAS